MFENVQNVQAVPELTQVAVDYAKEDEGFVSDKIAPVAPVKLDAFKYAKWGREDLKDIDRTSRAIGTPANTVTKLTKVYVDGNVERDALKDAIADEILNNDPNPAIFRNKRVKSLVRKLRMGEELKTKAILDASMLTAAAPANKWDTAATTTIESDFDAAKEAMVLNLGVEPNWVIIPKLVANAVRRNATIRELIKYNPNDLLKNGQLPAPLFGLNVMIPGGLFDAAQPGAAAAAIGRIWGGETVYFLFVDPDAQSDTMTALLKFRNMETAQPFAVKSWRDPDQSANLSWFSSEIAQKIIGVTPEAVYLIPDVLV